jgi:hypothetical protein
LIIFDYFLDFFILTKQMKHPERGTIGGTVQQ